MSGQGKYVERILERFDMKNFKNVKTLGVSGINLDDCESKNKIDATYQDMLGSIGYLVRKQD